MNEGRIASEVRGRGGTGVRIRKILSPRGTGKELSRPPCPGLKPGGKEKILTVKVEAPEEKILQYLEAHVITGKDPGNVSGP